MKRLLYMKHYFGIITLFLLSINLFSQELSKEEKELAAIINEYRKSKKLPPLKISKSLTIVATAHTADLNKYGNKIKKGTNMHSWSKYGKWKPVDYYEDHRNAKLMWSKPSELTNYKGPGYEIVFYNSENCTPQDCIDGWRSSPGHNSVIIESGTWKKVNFSCMGISIDKNYAAVWFGVEEDPAGYIE